MSFMRKSLTPREFKALNEGINAIQSGQPLKREDLETLVLKDRQTEFFTLRDDRLRQNKR